MERNLSICGLSPLEESTLKGGAEAQISGGQQCKGLQRALANRIEKNNFYSFVEVKVKDAQ